MKQRKGLVSNSSSSSFVCIIMKDAYDKAVANLDSPTRECLDSMLSDCHVFGIPAKEFSSFGSESYSSWENVESPNDLDPHDIWNDFIKTIPSQCKWTTSVDF